MLIAAAPSGVGSNVATVIANGSPTISVVCTLVTSTLSIGTFIMYLKIMNVNSQVSIRNIITGWIFQGNHILYIIFYILYIT